MKADNANMRMTKNKSDCAVCDFFLYLVGVKDILRKQPKEFLSRTLTSSIHDDQKVATLELFI